MGQSSRYMFLRIAQFGRRIKVVMKEQDVGHGKENRET